MKPTNKNAQGRAKPETKKMIEQPTPSTVKSMREYVGDTQSSAAILVHANLRTWQAWEDDTGSKNARTIPLAAWELYLIKTDQHPNFTLISK